MKGWNNTRLKNLLNEPLLYGLNVSSEYEDRDMPRYIRITDFDDFNNLNEQTFKSLPEEIAQSAQLKDGDLLFARSGASVGKTFLYRPLPNGACYAGYLIRARFDRQRVMPEYVSYYTKSQGYENWKNATYIQATIQNISAERYYQLPISIPPLEEQGRIVSYLNDKTGKIDARISLLTKKRDAYQRLKKALISRVVTKGLNPNAKFKPSGVDWIGEIPEGWKVKRIKDVCGINVLTLNEQMPPNYMFKYIDISSVSNGSIKLSEPITFWEAPSRARRIVSEDDIIVSTVRTYLKAIAHINWKTQDIIASTGFAVITPTKFINPLYLSFYFHHDSLVDDICRNSCGVSFPATTSSFISRLPLLLPPFSEQQSIATYLDEKCSEIDANIANLEKQIEKYKELKRALISEVVTGKRRV